MPEEPILDIQNLSKKFRDVQAVDRLNMTVFRGDIYGLLGPNGSGKSTTIRMALSLIKPDAGTISIFGLNQKNNRSRILRRTGSFVERPDFYDYLSAYKNLAMLSEYAGIKADRKKIEEVLDLTGLKSRMNSKVKTFSKGMKQRLGIAQALLNDPELLILDEPASGLDPSGFREIRELILLLNRERNKTIILSSHQLPEIELIANRMIIINKGAKVVEGNVKELLEEHSYYARIEPDNLTKAEAVLKNSRFDIEKIELSGSAIRVYCKRDLIPLIIKHLIEQDVLIKSAYFEQNLEDYFLTLT